MSDQHNDRQFLFEVWRKIQNQQRLNSMEKMVSRIINMHPESHTMLSQPEAFANHEFSHDEPDHFAHLGLHAIVMEMVREDSPRGIRSIYDQRVNQTKNKHESQHELMIAVFDWMVTRPENEMKQDEDEMFVASLRDQFDLSTPQS